MSAAPSRQPKLFGYNHAPIVLGVASTPEGLALATSKIAALPCDAIEIRCGEATTDQKVFVDSIQAIHATGKSVLATLRNKTEGGTWEDEDPIRLEWFKTALQFADAVDVELASPFAKQACLLADEAGIPVVLSLHNFQQTPPADYLLEKMQEALIRCQHPIFKAACQVNTSDDISTLRKALDNRPANLPTCIIGMGNEGAQTRLEFALHGSRLLYGYLDQPNAPGQFSCRILREFLSVQSAEYRQALLDRAVAQSQCF